MQRLTGITFWLFALVLAAGHAHADIPPILPPTPGHPLFTVVRQACLQRALDTWTAGQPAVCRNTTISTADVGFEATPADLLRAASSLLNPVCWERLPDLIWATYQCPSGSANEITIPLINKRLCQVQNNKLVNCPAVDTTLTPPYIEESVVRWKTDAYLMSSPSCALSQAPTTHHYLKFEGERGLMLSGVSHTSMEITSKRALERRSLTKGANADIIQNLRITSPAMPTRLNGIYPQDCSINLVVTMNEMGVESLKEAQDLVAPLKLTIQLKTEARDAYLAAHAATLASQLLYQLAGTFSGQVGCGAGQELAKNAEAVTELIHQITVNHPEVLSHQQLDTALTLLDIVNRSGVIDPATGIECTGSETGNPLRLRLSAEEQSLIDRVLAAAGPSDQESPFLVRAKELTFDIAAAQYQFDLAKAQMPQYADKL